VTESQSVIDHLKACDTDRMPLAPDQVLHCFHGLSTVTKKAGLLLSHLLRLSPDELGRRGEEELQLYLDLREAVEKLGH
jgi:hypothetical protein